MTAWPLCSGSSLVVRPCGAIGGSRPSLGQTRIGFEARQFEDRWVAPVVDDFYWKATEVRGGAGASCRLAGPATGGGPGRSSLTSLRISGCHTSRRCPRRSAERVQPRRPAGGLVDDVGLDVLGATTSSPPSRALAPRRATTNFGRSRPS